MDWVGYDLDGTLAVYEGFRGLYIGDPVPKMIEHLKATLASGVKVKIFTARVATADKDELETIQRVIRAWSRRHIGQELEITCVKDRDMLRLYDDRAYHVITNTGIILEPKE